LEERDQRESFWKKYGKDTSYMTGIGGLHVVIVVGEKIPILYIWF
jgi:hypothetical protein